MKITMAVFREVACCCWWVCFEHLMILSLRLKINSPNSTGFHRCLTENSGRNLQSEKVILIKRCVRGKCFCSKGEKWRLIHTVRFFWFLLRFVFAWWCCRSRIVWTLPLSPVQPIKWFVVKRRIAITIRGNRTVWTSPELCTRCDLR